MPPGEEHFVSGTIDLMAGVSDKDVFPVPDPAYECFLRIRKDAVVRFGSEKQNGAGDLFGLSRREDPVGHADGFQRPVPGRNAVLEFFSGRFDAVIPGKPFRIRGARSGEILRAGICFHEKRVVLLLSQFFSNKP